jgi:uncharacterized protein (TIGR02996 family)
MSSWHAESCPQAMSLLAQCKQDPDDDAPRLILADWLSEHDDLRGELMRVQVQRAHLRRSNPQWAALHRRERQLVRQYLPTWLGPLVGMTGEWEFRRGLLWLGGLFDTLLDGSELLWHRLELWTWVEGLRISEGMPECVSWLANCPALAALACLDLSGDGSEYGDQGAGRLSVTPHLVGLAHLNLANNNISDTGATALAHSPQLAWLTRLNLSRNRIGPAGAQALVGSPYLPRTLALDLRHNQLSASVKRSLRQRFGEGVQV